MQQTLVQTNRILILSLVAKLVLDQLLAASDADALTSVLSHADEHIKGSKEIVSYGKKKKLAYET